MKGRAQSRARLNRTGFTLIELLIAATATIAIISAAGYGLIAILQFRNAADASLIQRQQLNRALSYIADEVRMSQAIDPAGDASVPGFTLPPSAQSVLVLTIPAASSHYPVVYYLQPSVAPWLPPYSIVRWGPDLNSDGTYNLLSTHAYTLVDSISAEAANETCSKPETLAVPAAPRHGFTACIWPNGKAADLFLKSTFTDSAGKSSTAKLTLRVMARSD